MASLAALLSPHLSRLGTALLLLCAALLSSCTSSGPKIAGVPSNLATIPLYGQARTPPHNMSHGSYPFDANGNYVTAWAAEGGNAPGPSGYSSHRDEDSPPPRRSSSASTVSTRKSSSTVSRVASSPPPTKKPTSSGSSSPPAKKPTSSGGSTRHVVKGNDTLWGLAKKYGSSVAKIKAANGLKSDSIRDGMVLTIPR